MKLNFSKSIAYLFLIHILVLSSCKSINDSLKLADSELEVLKTKDDVEFVRTPDMFFENLPDWNYEHHYVEIDGLRQAYIDEGPKDADPILLLHGQPSWSYLYRHMIPVLVEKGHRVIAMDHLGMGKSDKPIDIDYYSFDIHLNRLKSFMNELQLKRTTVFLQDWGSVIGLYAAASDFDLFDRIILGNGGLPIVEKPYALPNDMEKSMSEFDGMMNMIPAKQPSFFDKDGNSKLPINDGSEDAGGFSQWMAYAKYYKEFQVSRMIEALTFNPISKEEEAAYDAPFPARITMAGPRSFPSLLNDLVGRTEAKREALTRYEKPFLTIFGQNDPGLAGDNTQQWVIDNVPGAKGQAHHIFPDASHYLQDDKGVEIAKMVNDFIEKNPI